MEISFDVTSHEHDTILKLARRARSAEKGCPRDIMAWTMDFSVVHANGNPLRLDALLAADDFNFMHDAFGICRHLNRETGKLENFFSPRYSA